MDVGVVTSDPQLFSLLLQLVAPGTAPSVRAHVARLGDYLLSITRWDGKTESVRALLDDLTQHSTPRWLVSVELGHAVIGAQQAVIGDVVVASAYRRASRSQLMAGSVPDGLWIENEPRELANALAASREAIEASAAEKLAGSDWKRPIAALAVNSSLAAIPSTSAFIISQIEQALQHASRQGPRLLFGPTWEWGDSQSSEPSAVDASAFGRLNNLGLVTECAAVADLAQEATQRAIPFLGLVGVKGWIGIQDVPAWQVSAETAAVTLLDAILSASLIEPSAPRLEATEGTDRLTRLTIGGLRTIDHLTLDLRDGMLVLVGENGVGKSSILEACEILRRASAREFVAEVDRIHGGLFMLLRRGANELTLGARIEGAGRPLEYRLVLGTSGGTGSRIVEETLVMETDEHTAKPLSLILRNRDRTRVYRPLSPTKLERFDVAPGETVLAALAEAGQGGVPRATRALEHIDVHLPFDVTPFWAAQAHHREAVMRKATTLAPATKLERFGENMANAYQALRNEQSDREWATTMERVRLGVGDEIEDVRTLAIPGGGALALYVKLRSIEQPVPASAVSDGMLAYLAFVAMARLKTPRSLLAIDEPDLHLHPGLVARVIDLLKPLARSYPVVIATQSDALLDALNAPAEAVRVCELREARLEVRKLDPERLDAWREDFTGVGGIRAAGYLPLALQEPKAT